MVILLYLVGVCGIFVIEIDFYETFFMEFATVSIRATAAGALPALVDALVATAG